MGTRRIFTFPEPSLTEVAGDVANISGDTVQALDDMAQTMYAAPGIGLAAPQIGLPERIIVVDIGDDSEGGGEQGKNLVELINPIVTDESDELITFEEGCLSVIDFRADVTRPAQIVVSGWTRDQKEVSIEAEGLLAVCLQHEIDHLDGTLFLDRLSRLKRNMYAKRVKKALREGRPIARDSD
ncbi:MAG: peptide deformylase [Deltaproteobacteria bacterium]